MASCSLGNQFHDIFMDSVNQKPIWAYVAFTKGNVFSLQGMVTVHRRQSLPCGQYFKNRLQLIHRQPPFLSLFEILLELPRVSKFKHSGPSTYRLQNRNCGKDFAFHSIFHSFSGCSIWNIRCNDFKRNSSLVDYLPENRVTAPDMVRPMLLMFLPSVSSTLRPFGFAHSLFP